MKIILALIVMGVLASLIGSIITAVYYENKIKTIDREKIIDDGMIIADSYPIEMSSDDKLLLFSICTLIAFGSTLLMYGIFLSWSPANQYNKTIGLWFGVALIGELFLIFANLWIFLNRNN